VLRLALLTSHYRQSLNWNEKTIKQSKNILDKLYRVLNKVEDVELDCMNIDDFISSKFINSLCDDLNTSKALANINETAKKLSKESDLEIQKKLKSELLLSGKILGILQSSSEEWLGINKTNKDTDTKKIEGLIDSRNDARKQKNFNLADKIRLELKKMGVEIEDTHEKTIWKIK